ncbi:DBH-like monooxygenase protein 1 homolog [Gordionus sp. m RMFG-2023]|uniref:DBH-like monooxygenase protein 1 homolog n=1 Tax=Gordionus sp. m RMFG-2023 TaxID=3053472 RepID=UPI0031FD4A8E
MEINIIQRGFLKLSWKLLIYAAILLTIFLNILTVATVSTPYKNDETSLFEYSLCLEEKGNDNFLSNENKKSDHSTYCKILIHWNFNDSHVWFEMEAETLGYITFGFSSTPNLIHSDVIIAWITTNGTIYFRDSYMINDNLPLTDEYQDYQYSGKQNSTHTLLNFVRKRDTCDSMDFRLTPDTIYLHWSYHSSDPDISDSQNSFLFHGLVRGVRPVNLFNRYPNDFSKYGIEQIGYNNNIGNSTRSNTATIDKDSDGRKMGAETVRTFDLSIKVNTKTNNDELNKLKILSFASPYLCQLFKLPILSSSLNVDKKYHIIKRKLTIKSPNIMYSTPGYKIGNQVHDRDHDGEDTIKNAVKDKALKHAVLYSCSRDVDFSQTFPDLEGNIFPCYQQSFPAEMFYCNDIVTGYTLGGDEEFYWPPEAGHSMGTSSDAEYVMLELLIDQTKIPLSEISGVDEKARYEMGNTASKNEKGII